MDATRKINECKSSKLVMTLILSIFFVIFLLVAALHTRSTELCEPRTGKPVPPTLQRPPITRDMNNTSAPLNITGEAANSDFEEWIRNLDPRRIQIEHKKIKPGKAHPRAIFNSQEQAENKQSDELANFFIYPSLLKNGTFN